MFAFCFLYFKYLLMLINVISRLKNIRQGDSGLSYEMNCCYDNLVVAAAGCGAQCGDQSAMCEISLTGYSSHITK